MQLNNNQQAFFELLRAGLWGKEARLSQFGNVDYEEVMRLAEEQSVLGLVTAGLEQVSDSTVPKEILLQFIGSTLQIEQQNKEMNVFLARLIEMLRKNDICSLLVKGQGIAQCYERPLWRSSGDVDLFLSDSNYQKAKECLLPLASSVEEEDSYEKHLGFIIDSWSVELHGTLRSRSLPQMDKIIDEVQKDVFYSGSVRSWMNGRTVIFLPAPDNDVIFVFTHIIKHFFHGGIGLRQICDWCRLLWTYKDSINRRLLESRIKEAGIVTEWNTFAALAIGYLGMPVEVIPLYPSGVLKIKRFERKANKVLGVILKTGNFGHNEDKSYMLKYGVFKRKLTTVWLGTQESFRNFFIFPMDSIKVWFNLRRKGICVLIRGRR